MLRRIAPFCSKILLDRRIDRRKMEPVGSHPAPSAILEFSQVNRHRKGTDGSASKNRSKNTVEDDVDDAYVRRAADL